VQLFHMCSLQDCSVLSFLFDNLLPSTQDVGDKDTPALCRVLIASLAACNHSPETQLHLATEIKLALQRALTLPETAEKHSRIQSLASIIATVIDACPVSGAIPNQVIQYLYY
jgi:E3 ubiquitin-protein ligase HUWE1